MVQQTAVEWLIDELYKFEKGESEYFSTTIIKNKAIRMEKHQQDTFAIEFAEWYENDVLAKGDYEMIAKDKKELLKIFKETYGKQ